MVLQVKRQVFSRDPVTGRPTWRYIDLGPARGVQVRGMSLGNRTTERTSYGRKVNAKGTG